MAPASKRTAAHRAVNPFERTPTSLKYNILGKAKGNKTHAKSLALARSEAFQARKQSLLVEAQQAGKSNKFIDRRFAEDQNIPDEDKMLMRFQRERLARARKSGSAFNLPDDEDDELVTHGGVALGDLDDYGKAEAPDSDDENLGRDTVRQYHFGGFLPVETKPDDSSRVKTKREVMQEIIAKSKIHKAEKRREKAEREDLIEQLNAEFKDISSLLESKIRSKDAPKKGRQNVDSTLKELSADDKDSTDFDVLAKELAFEIRARPSDRLKTSEELEKEEYERLQKAERERLKRMQGEENDSDEDKSSSRANGKRVRFEPAVASGDALDDNCLLGPPGARRIRGDLGAKSVVVKHGSGDAAEDGSEEDAEATAAGEDSGSDESGESDESENEESQEDESDRASSLGGSNQGDSEEADEDGAQEQGDEPQMRATSAVSRPSSRSEHLTERCAVSSSNAAPCALSDLPFVLEMPSSLVELEDLLHLRSKEEQCAIMERLLACHSISVSADNRGKLQGLHSLLWERLDALALSNPSQLSSIDACLHGLYRLGGCLGEHAVAHDCGRLNRLQTELEEGLGRGEGPCWPDAADLLFLRVIMTHYPTTDFEHPVATPALVLMAHFLSHCPLSSPTDVAAALWVCALVHEATAPAARVVPEVVALLTALLAMALPRASLAALSPLSPAHAAHAAWAVYASHSEQAEVSLNWLRGEDAAAARQAAEAQQGLRLEHLLRVQEHGHEATPSEAAAADRSQLRASALSSALRLALHIAHSYARPSALAASAFAVSGSRLLQADATAGLAAIVAPLASVAQLLLHSLPRGGALHRECQELLQTLQGIARSAAEPREPLRLYSTAPVGIKQYVPKFEERFAPDQDMDPDRERAERNKLRKRVRKEMKGAARELRKDNAFLEEERAKQLALQRKARDERAKAIEAFLTQQQSEAKIGQSKRSRRR